MDLPPIKDSSMCSQETKSFDRAHVITNGNRKRLVTYEPLVGTYRVNKMFPLAANIAATTRPGDQIIFMSNGGFEGASRRLLTLLREGMPVEVSS